jgi:D-glycerate 3-kinase
MGALSFTKEEQKRIIEPLADDLSKLHQSGTTIVGFQGGQGTGKTSIVKFLKKSLNRRKYQVTTFSIDDFYQTAEFRRTLSKKYPLNAFYQISRGLPGTHRFKELLKVLQAAKGGRDFRLPVFDKSLYNGFGDVTKTLKVTGRQDFIVLEGWCVGIPVVSSPELIRICQKNKINLKALDPQLKDHKVVLSFVKEYQSSWKMLDYMVMIKPDSSSVHKKWRALQEYRMKKSGKSGMNETQVGRFVEPYLPFTYLCYDKIHPDALIKVDIKHNYYKIKT